MKVIDYKIAVLRDADMTALIAEGWQPYGEPFYVPLDEVVMQAVVKYDESEGDELRAEAGYILPRPTPNTPRSIPASP